MERSPEVFGRPFRAGISGAPGEARGDYHGASAERSRTGLFLALSLFRPASNVRRHLYGFVSLDSGGGGLARFRGCSFGPTGGGFGLARAFFGAFGFLFRGE